MAKYVYDTNTVCLKITYRYVENGCKSDCKKIFSMSPPACVFGHVCNAVLSTLSEGSAADWF